MHPTLSGWTAGAGVETRLGASNWSVKLEYLYMDFGSVSFTANCTDRAARLLALAIPQCEELTSHVTDHVFRVGVNYSP